MLPWNRAMSIIFIFSCWSGDCSACIARRRADVWTRKSKARCERQLFLSHRVPRVLAGQQERPACLYGATMPPYSAVLAAEGMMASGGGS